MLFPGFGIYGSILRGLEVDLLTHMLGKCKAGSMYFNMC